MNRRNFMRTMLGVAAATALPSEVWPFRKIFLPAQPTLLMPPEIPAGELESIIAYGDAIYALQMQNFRAKLPSLLGGQHNFYKILRATKSMPSFRIPMRVIAV